MSGTVYATFDDVEKVWLGDGFDTDSREAAEELLAFASAALRTYLPKIDTWLAAETVEEILVRGVTRDMVLRVMRNPDLVRSEQIDDYAQTWDTTMLRAGLVPTAAELNLLRPASTTTRSPVGVARVRPVF